MKAIVNVKFNDLKVGKLREVGDTFILSKARFAEINEKIPGCLCEVHDADQESECCE